MSEFRQLGLSGVRVSPLALGTANFGWMTDGASAGRMLDVAIDRGVNFIDTADIYNRDAGDDRSESIVGRWLSDDAGRRQQVILATKVYGTTGAGVNDRGLSARHIQLACDESLRRLRTDWIDVYMLHHVDRAVQPEETLEALSRLIAQGKILYVGTSNFAAWQLTALHLTATVRSMLGLVSEQSPYSLVERRVELEVLPACRRLGIGFLAYSPLAAGLLAGPDTGLRRATAAVAARREQEATRLNSWYERCRAASLDPAAAALAWVLAQPGVVSAVVGPRTEAQLQSCVDAANLRLDEATLESLALGWPGPGTAPEAYAW